MNNPSKPDTDKTSVAPAVTLGELMRNAAQKFAAAGLGEVPGEAPGNALGNAMADARVLCQFAGGYTRTQMISLERDPVTAELLEKFETLVERRLAREPVYRIIGAREFYGRQFVLSPDTLEPRPDTELLIDCVISRFDRHQPLKIADIGTGTGAIAVTLLCEFEAAHCVATDISQGAINIAAQNATIHQVSGRFEGVVTNFAEALGEGFDLIVSNPPYIAQNEYDGLQPEVRLHDPVRALVSGQSGFEAYEAIIEQLSRKSLVAGGLLMLELGKGQGGGVSRIGTVHGFKVVALEKDINGIERVLILQKK